MDWNQRARELMAAGASAKQVLRVRKHLENVVLMPRLKDVTSVNGKGEVVATRNLMAKEDVFYEPFEWIGDNLWTEYVPSAARLAGTLELYHSESPLMSSVRHSWTRDASVSVLAFAWWDQACIVLPVRDIRQGEELTRDAAIGLVSPNKKASFLFAANVSFANPLEQQQILDIVRVLEQQPLQGSDLVLNYDRIGSGLQLKRQDRRSNDRSPLQIFTDDPVLRAYFATVENDQFILATEDKAKFWYSLKQLPVGTSGAVPSHVQAVNQFPFESCLVRKDLCLVQVCRACKKTFPNADNWILPAYDLETELAVFAKREFTNGKSNFYWALKPAQQARGSGLVVTNDLGTVLATMNGPGGDKVAQRYVMKPLLLDGRRKFDMRTLVLVQSFSPLVAWFSLDLTYARIARADFDHNAFTQMTKGIHLTVSRYDIASAKQAGNDFPPAVPMHVLCMEYLNDSQRERWPKYVLDKLHSMLREIFLAGSHFVGKDRFPPCCGACYGVDWMVDESMDTKLIEINYCPDLSFPASLNRNLTQDVLTALSTPPGYDCEFVLRWVRL